MISIGNDIIALKTIDIPRTRSFRFYSKILSVPEQQLYQAQFTDVPFELFVWLLWSVKESVYKCLQRDQSDLPFSPVKIEVARLVAPAVQSQSFPGTLTSTGFVDAECFCSEVRFESQLFYTRSVIYSDEVISTVAQPAPCYGEPFEPSRVAQPQVSLRQAQADIAFSESASFSTISWGIKQIAQSDPENQSKAVREFLLKNIKPSFPGRQLSIGKSISGYPFIIVDGVEQDILVSLSHHGAYVGYAINSNVISIGGRNLIR